MIHHPLTIVIFTSRDNRTYITRLNSIISVVIHKAESIMQLFLVIGNRGCCFMMHNNFNSFTCSIFMQTLHIKIGICLCKAVNTLLGVCIVIFPTFIPSFHKNSIKAMFCRKVNIFLYMSGICSMMTMRMQFCIIGLTYYNILCIGIRPC